MLEIKREKTFKKDLSKVKMTDKHYAKYISYISKLLEKKPLPPEAKDHALIGNFNGAREFHISGDLIIIYVIKNDSLILARIGSHSQLFS